MTTPQTIPTGSIPLNEREMTATVAPELRQIVRARQRRYLVEDIVKPTRGGDQTVVTLACLGDDAQGETEQLLWESEIDAEILDDGANWEHVKKRDFDDAAPASGSLYAVDSKLTGTVRDVAPLFKHRLFLSATLHNGHSNNFAALLEILAPYRSCRGVPVRNRKLLEPAMVRHLKCDFLRLPAFQDAFPRREPVSIVIDGLPEDAPEFVLSRVLQQYREMREIRLPKPSLKRRNVSTFVLKCLQKRLLSSIPAFYNTLKKYREALNDPDRWVGLEGDEIGPKQLALLDEPASADDERQDRRRRVPRLSTRSPAACRAASKSGWRSFSTRHLAPARRTA